MRMSLDMIIRCFNQIQKQKFRSVRSIGCDFFLSDGSLNANYRWNYLKNKDFTYIKRGDRNVFIVENNTGIIYNTKINGKKKSEIYNIENITNPDDVSKIYFMR